MDINRHFFKGIQMANKHTKDDQHYWSLGKYKSRHNEITLHTHSEITVNTHLKS